MTNFKEKKDHILHTVRLVQMKPKTDKRITVIYYFGKNPKTQMCWFTEVKNGSQRSEACKEWYFGEGNVPKLGTMLKILRC